MKNAALKILRFLETRVRDATISVSLRGKSSPFPRKEIPMSLLRERMIQDMQLHGFSASTQEVYVRAVSQMSQYVHHGPDKVTEEELRQYFLYLANEKKSSRSTTTVALCGIKFFYEHTLHRDWPTLRLVRPAPEYKLPVVLSREEVRRVL